MLEVSLARRQLVTPEAGCRCSALELIGIGRAAAELVALGAAPAGQGADARTALVIDDDSRDSRRDRAAGPSDVKPGRPSRAPRSISTSGTAARRDPAHHRLADRIGRPVGIADWPVEQRDAVPALQIGGVRQHQIGIGHHLGEVGIGVDDARDLVGAALGILVGQHGHGVGRVHGRVPGHVGHVEEQGVDRIGIARPGVGRITMCIIPWTESGASQERPCRSGGRPVWLDQQIFRAGRKAQRRAGQGPGGGHLLCAACRTASVPAGMGFGKGGL